MKPSLAAGCAGSILMFAAAATAQPAPPPPPPPADYEGDSYSPEESSQAYADSDAGEQGYDDQGPGDDSSDGQVYSDAGEPMDQAAGDAFDDRGVDPSVPADAEDPPYAYPAPGPDEPDYPPQPPLPPLPPGPAEPPEPPMPGMEMSGFGGLEMREERLARAIRQGLVRGELPEEDGYEAQRELESITAERRYLESAGYSGAAMAQLDSRMRRLQRHVSSLRRVARGEAPRP